MIKLNRLFTPIKLTPDFVSERTDVYKKTGEAVWNVDWLKEALSELSHGKCAYCECSIRVESTYMEVEHFEDKKQNPDKVMVWENLLPSCKHCNVHKSTHDVVKEPIVNPFVDDPRDHLYLQRYRYKSKDIKGQNTIDTLQLNDDERNLVQVRFEIGNALEKLIDEFKERFDTYRTNMSVRSRNKMLSVLTEMLRQCQAESEYSALCSTVLQTNVTYQQIRANLQAEGLWTREFDKMDVISSTICLMKT